MQLKKINVNSPLIVSRFQEHNNIKQILLEKISNSDSQSISNSNDKITKTDFYIDEQREYKEYLLPKLANHMKEVFRDFTIPEFAIGNIWFQQYNISDEHDWHVHPSCHWTNVYFVELPTVECKTIVREVLSLDTINYQAQEGDIITFPSYFYHKSPKNNVLDRKTVISFNINFR